MQTGLADEIQTMAMIKPFQAWRYHLEKVELRSVIAPPYDVISSQDQNRLYERSPYNCVRLILNREEPSDNAENNRYTRAKQCFETWKNEKILIRESRPAFYVYSQTFRDLMTGEPRKRTSLLVSLKLEDFEKGIVLPHEKTLDKPKRDRRRLIETTSAVFSPIFGLFEDQESRVSSCIGKMQSENKSVSVKDDQGVEHEFLAVTDPQVLEEIQTCLAGKKIYIADGHHRYQTALDYAREMRRLQQVPEGREMPYDYTLAALVPFEDSGLSIFPTHRIVRNLDGWDPQKAMKALADVFNVQAKSGPELSSYLQRSKDGLEFGVILGGKEFLLQPKSMEALKSRLAVKKPDVWYQLDVNILGYLIFSKLWGFQEDQWEDRLEFTHSYEEALKAARRSDVSAVFLLKSPSVELVRNMCEARELMPQKSTYFYPKLASGFVFYQH